MNILFVGGASFIGAYVIRRLLRDGHAIIVYDTNVRNNAIQKVLSGDELGSLELMQGDVLDPVHLMRVAQQTRPDRLVHLAAALGPQCDEEPALATRVNCDGFNHSLEVARTFGIGRVVWASSTAVYGSPSAYPEEYPDEGAPHYPQNVYGVTKSFNEHLAEHYFQRFGVDSIGLRFPVVYGPGRLRGALPYQFWVELVEKPVANLPGRVPVGDSLVDWQYVEDTAAAIVAALLHEGTATRVFNTGGDLQTIRQAVEYVSSLLPRADLDALPGTWEGIAKLDTRKIEKELGYHPEFSLKQGLQKSIRVLNGDEISGSYEE